jgi:hypothetical protein
MKSTLTYILILKDHSNKSTQLKLGTKLNAYGFWTIKYSMHSMYYYMQKLRKQFSYTPKREAFYLPLLHPYGLLTCKLLLPGTH